MTLTPHPLPCRYSHSVLPLPDRHAEKPLSLRMGAERLRVEDAAKREGIPVRQWILAAIREKLARDAQPLA